MLAFALSRLCLTLMEGYTATMGVVLNLSKVYPLEWVILIAVFVISVLPTALCTLVMSKKDSVG